MEAFQLDSLGYFNLCAWMKEAIGREYVLSSSAQGNVVTVLISPYLLDTIGVGNDNAETSFVLWVQESEWSWVQYFDSYSMVESPGCGILLSHSQHFTIEGAASKFYLYLPLADELLCSLREPQFIFLRKLRDISQVAPIRRDTVTSVSKEMAMQCAAGAPLLFVDHVKYAS